MNLVEKIYQDLLKKHGAPSDLWPQWCDQNKSDRDKQIVAIGAILVQRTSWRNAEKALENLKEKGLLSTAAIANSTTEVITPLIRVAGFFQTKPKRLLTFCQFFEKEILTFNYGGKIESLRERLLGLYGIGPETADTLISFAFGRPSFIIDEYTKRFVKREGLAKDFRYDSLKKFFEENLPPVVEIYQNLHILMILDQKDRKYCSMKIV